MKLILLHIYSPRVGNFTGSHLAKQGEETYTVKSSGWREDNDLPPGQAYTTLSLYPSTAHTVPVFWGSACNKIHLAVDCSSTQALYTRVGNQET